MSNDSIFKLEIYEQMMGDSIEGCNAWKLYRIRKK